MKPMSTSTHTWTQVDDPITGRRIRWPADMDASEAAAQGKMHIACPSGWKKACFASSEENGDIRINQYYARLELAAARRKMMEPYLN